MDRAEIEQALGKIAQGEWLEREDFDYYQNGVYIGVGPEKYVPREDSTGNKRVPCDLNEVEYFAHDICRVEGTEDEKEFIKHAPAYIRWLLTELDRVTQELDAWNERHREFCRVEVALRADMGAALAGRVRELEGALRTLLEQTHALLDAQQALAPPERGEQ